MATKNIVELNTTKTIDAINGLDTHIATSIQTLLSPVYDRFPFLSSTIFGIPIANLVAAVIALLFFLMLRGVFTNTVSSWLQKLAKRTKTHYDDKIISALKHPLSLGFVLVGWHIFFILTFQETDFIKHLLNTFTVFLIFWAIVSVAEALKGILYHATEKLNPDLSKEMGNLVLKMIKVVIWGIGFAAMLQVWGIDVTALIASLGLGGLAFALAAKDTAANLFGSFAILADKSIRIGEWIKVDGIEGVVEDIGTRTTKIRTFEKSLIVMPNMILASKPIENYSRRGVRRIKMHIGLVYSTSKEQLSKIVEDIKQMLHQHDKISNKETIMVNFDTFGDSSLDIFIYAFSKTSNWQSYMDTKEDINLKIIEIVHQNNSDFAFPSQSIYIEKTGS